MLQNHKELQLETDCQRKILDIIFSSAPSDVFPSMVFQGILEQNTKINVSNSYRGLELSKKNYLKLKKL